MFGCFAPNNPWVLRESGPLKGVSLLLIVPRVEVTCSNHPDRKGGDVLNTSTFETLIQVMPVIFDSLH